jgi:hypothetical protein
MTSSRVWMMERGAGKPEKRDTCTVRTYAPPNLCYVTLTPPPNSPKQALYQPQHLTTTTDRPAPASTPACNCSLGGSWVLRPYDGVGQRQDASTTHQPPPVSRATARGVDHGSNGADDAPTTDDAAGDCALSVPGVPSFPLLRPSTDTGAAGPGAQQL